MRQARNSRWGLAVLAALPFAALAADAKPWQLNMGRGVTASAQHAYDAHMLALIICVAIGAVVFVAMAYAMFKFRHSKGAVPDTSFTHSTKLEVMWTVIPVILLVIMAVPATAKLIAMYDTRDSQMTVKVTGIQWMWKYEYLGEGVEITSRLDRESDRLRQNPATTRAELVFGHADGDRSMPPEAVAALGAAAADAGLTVRNEVYPDAPHGYTMADTSMYQEAGAERHFTVLRDLLDRTL